MEPVVDLAVPADPSLVAPQAPPRVAPNRAASSSSSGPDFANLDTQGWLDYLLADLPAAAPAAAAAPKSGPGSVAFSLFSEGWDDDSQNFMINAAFGKQREELHLHHAYR